MVKLEGVGRPASFTESLMVILGHRPASVPSSLLDTGTSASSMEPQESEPDEGENNTNGKIEMLYMIVHTHCTSLNISR